MNVSDDHVWMVLGTRSVDGDAVVAIVVGAPDAQRARDLYQRDYPGYDAISWPRLSDLKQSIEAMERARNGEPLDLCPVILDDEVVETEAISPMTGLPCPASVLRVLDTIRALLDKRGLPDPFGNNAASFRSGVFTVQSYRWEPEAPGYFQWRDLRVEWYKHLHREPVVNRLPAREELDEMLAECRAAIALAI